MQNAASLRQQEKEAKKQATEALKEQRKRRQKPQKAPEPEEDDDATASDGDEEEGDDEDEDIDMLPDDVLDALVDDETHDRRLMQKRIISEQLRLKRKPKQRKTFSERQVGPVTVQVLKKGTNKKASGELVYLLCFIPSIKCTLNADRCGVYEESSSKMFFLLTGASPPFSLLLQKLHVHF